MEIRGLQRIGDSYGVTLPKDDLREALGRDPGEVDEQHVAIESEDGEFSIRLL